MPPGSLQAMPTTAMPHTTPLGLTYDSGDFARNLQDALAAADAGGFAARRAEARRRGHSWPDVYEWSPDSMPEGATVDDGTAYVLAFGVWGRDPDLRAVTDELRERESELKQAKKERKALKSLLG